MSTLLVVPKAIEDVIKELQEDSIRDHVIGLWDIVQGAKNILLWRTLRGNTSESFVRSLQDVRCLLQYATEYPSRKRRTPMDVDDMVKRWVPIIRGLSTAHDKAPLDECEFQMEQHLTPLLTAPVKQIREFCMKLCDALEADPTIPFFVWAWFRSWNTVILQKAPDGDIKALKVTLAEEIAELVERHVQPDLKTAIAAALAWRSEESLTKVKAAVEKGGQVRMVGRESCLFLEVEVEGDTVRVML